MMDILQGRRVFILPGIICAFLCLFFLQSGIFLPLYLCPLAFAAYCFNRLTGRFALLLAVGAKIFLGLGMVCFQKESWGGFLWGTVNFVFITGFFDWAVCGGLPGPADPVDSTNPAGSGGRGKEGEDIPRMTGAARLIRNAFFSCVIFIALFYGSTGGHEFLASLRMQSEEVARLYRSSLGQVYGADAVQLELLQELNPEQILGTLEFVALRGGLVAFFILLFFLNRQLARGLVFLFRRRRIGWKFSQFHTRPTLIWKTSFTLLFIILCHALGITFLEIVFWNLLVIEGICYLAQGLGILQFFASTRVPGEFRFLAPVIFLVIVLSPGINAFALGAILLLGIAEHWAPFRAEKTKEGPPPTPGV